MAREDGNFNQLRAQLGTDIAIKAYRDGTLPFPDGSIIVALHWDDVASDEDNKVFGSAQAFVAGRSRNIQFMVKDSKKYAATGGWGFADFTDGKPADEAMHKTCFACHEPVKARDFVYTRYTLKSGVREYSMQIEGSDVHAIRSAHPDVRCRENSTLHWTTDLALSRRRPAIIQ